jgi:hypothetical protein
MVLNVLDEVTGIICQALSGGGEERGSVLRGARVHGGGGGARGAVRRALHRARQLRGSGHAAATARRWRVPRKAVQVDPSPKPKR